MTTESGRKPVTIALGEGTHAQFSPSGHARMIGSDGQAVTGTPISDFLPKAGPEPQATGASPFQRQARITTQKAKDEGGTSIYELYGVSPDSATSNSDTK